MPAPSYIVAGTVYPLAQPEPPSGPQYLVRAKLGIDVGLLEYLVSCWKQTRDITFEAYVNEVCSHAVNMYLGQELGGDEHPKGADAHFYFLGRDDPALQAYLYGHTQVICVQGKHVILRTAAEDEERARFLANYQNDRLASGMLSAWSGLYRSQEAALAALEDLEGHRNPTNPGEQRW